MNWKDCYWFNHSKYSWSISSKHSVWYYFIDAQDFRRMQLCTLYINTKKVFDDYERNCSELSLSIFSITPLFSHALVSISDITEAGQISCNEYCPICLFVSSSLWTCAISSRKFISYSLLFIKKDFTNGFHQADSGTLNSLSFTGQKGN